MTQVHYTMRVGDAEPASSAPELDRSYEVMAQADAEPGVVPGNGDDSDLGGHTLLFRSPGAQGRRSLFRR